MIFSWKKNRRLYGEVKNRSYYAETNCFFSSKRIVDFFLNEKSLLLCGKNENIRVKEKYLKKNNENKVEKIALKRFTNFFRFVTIRIDKSKRSLIRYRDAGKTEYSVCFQCVFCVRKAIV